ncbi:MAG: acyl-CoA dehydrogenase [Planctomycetes bacterium]|nr:acyl-CoA dehydrogenase [Planctomycetota bacterium]
MTQTTSSGFVRPLFSGRLESAALFPYPHQDAEAAETTEAIVATVAEWAAHAVDPAAIDHAKTIPASVVAGLKELGLFGLTIPEEYGGAGQGQVTYARVMQTVAHRCASTVTVLGAQLGIGMKALVLYGTSAQKAHWLPKLASGERIAAFALTEAGAGSDAAALATRAEPQPDGSWKLNGRKIWITNGGIANGFTVFARTPDPAKPGAKPSEWPISTFWVERERKGLTTGSPENKMGLCGSSTTDVALEDVVVPPEALIGPRGEGFKVALNVLNSGRHGLAACCIGQAQLARDLARAHAAERVQFGHPIEHFGMVQELLAGMDADLYAMEATTYLTAGLMDQKRETMLEAACCKMHATERLWQIANDALQVTGGTGFMREYAYERILRDARINMIFEGTNQVLRMMIAFQGLRSLQRGELVPASGAAHLEGVCSELEAERTTLEALVPRFAASCQLALRTHGERVRAAQFALHRLADMAAALFVSGAVLSRASASRARSTLDARELDLARLACRRAFKDFERAAHEEQQPDDELVARIASASTG